MAKSIQEKSPHASKMAELGVTERQMYIWDLLGKGRTQREVASELGLSPQTINKDINRALAKLDDFAKREATDWRNIQLLLISEQISSIVGDTDVEPEMMLDEDGKAVLARNGAVRWVISHSEAARQRNSARQTLVRYLEHQAKLLALTTVKVEVRETKQVAIAVIKDIPSDDPDVVTLMEAL